jgi:hypothetical protein
MLRTDAVLGQGMPIYGHIQCDQKVSVHLMFTIQKVTSNVPSVPCQPLTAWQPTASLQTFNNNRLTLTPSIIPNSNYVIMVSD